MKKATIFAAALALVLSLAACGNRDNGSQTPGNQTNGSGTTENGSSTSGSSTNGNNSSGNNGGSTNGETGSGTGSGSTGSGSSNGTGGNVSGSLTDPNAGNDIGTGTGTGTGTDNSTGAGSADGQSRSRVGSDLRRAADSVGDAVSDMVDGGRNALSRVASADTTFEQMLDNARVHDTDGVLADGENSRW